MDNYSFDTHALVWFFLKKKTLSNKAEEVLRQVFKGEANGFVSILVVLEMYYVSLKEKDFNFLKAMEILENSNIRIIPFDKRVLEKTIKLPDELHIHDRIIIATAIVSNTPLITKDRILRRNFPLETIW